MGSARGQTDAFNRDYRRINDHPTAQPADDDDDDDDADGERSSSSPGRKSELVAREPSSRGIVRSYFTARIAK